jgi:hypothetical protein
VPSWREAVGNANFPAGLRGLPAKVEGERRNMDDLAAFVNESITEAFEPRTVRGKLNARHYSGQPDQIEQVVYQISASHR